MKKIINSTQDAVTEYLVGLSNAHPDIIEFDRSRRIIQRSTLPGIPKVGLISGGGSGCEPMHSGFVGTGGLDAACPGEIFTSPVPAQIIAATDRANTGAGVLMIIKNFGGEVMNFGLAAEIMKRNGVQVSKVIVNDDSSFPLGQEDRRRGLGATILVEKIAGAAAERGLDLGAVTRIAQKVVDNSRSYGIAFNSCTTPKLGKPTFEMAENEMDVGVGIGGDRGQERVPMLPADEIADLIMKIPAKELNFSPGMKLILLVSGLGSTPSIELYTLFGILKRKLLDQGISTARALVGNFITSLDTLGVTVTFLVVDEELTSLFDAPIKTPAIQWGI